MLGPMIESVFEEKGDRVNTLLVNLFHSLVSHLKDRKYVFPPIFPIQNFT